tara:strand:- start:285 stop:422 length:138 start_codon:yes stop_codon:yes gene_type:complete
MNGKKFIILLSIILLCFAGILFSAMYLNGWFDIFLDGGFKALYKK